MPKPFGASFTMRLSPEHHDPALYVRDHVEKPQIRKAGFQRFHSDDIGAADIDAAQEGEVTPALHDVRR
jgi:hypothetical protein